ncbi:MAG: glycoside hydrolase family 3 C-terminal domain-containing protein [Candidatus Glassbacteria bacterium]|nr:glycoside hydrolase family 3 C-terminal domain-containing protein [Candidatus Glassbacteria bacterium]
MPSKEQFIKDLVSRMTLEQKVGGCITFEFCGTRITPNEHRKINDYQVAGLRTTPHIFTEEPYGSRHDASGAVTQRLAPYATADQYAEILSELQEMAGRRPLSIPLHICSDQEGDLSCDIVRGGVNIFPSAMGMGATDDPDLVYRAYKAVARQQRAIGVTQLHSPCLDVNINPKNPEICTRSFGDDTERVIAFGHALVKAFAEEGIISTGKHFPGRGDSAVDVHFDLDYNKASRKRLDEVELAPYRALIAEGLACIMTAHTMYEALDPDGIPASVSRMITHELIRNDLGFDGLVTTDAMGMGGVAKKFSTYGEACAAAIAAGADLVLAKTHAENQQQVFDWIMRFVREGKIPMEELDEHNRRVLCAKWDTGLFDKHLADPKKVLEVIRDPGIRRLSEEVALKACVLKHDRGGVLPLSPDRKIFVTDQHYALWQNKGEDLYYHTTQLQKFVMEQTRNFAYWETELEPTDQDEKTCLELAADCEVAVVYSHYWRGNPTNTDLARKLKAAGKKLVVIAGAPYDVVCPQEADAVLVTFAGTPRSMEAACRILFGKDSPGGKWPLKLVPQN